ncbi:uncharacterized protein LOC123524397 [Mercenaria mercenaria]|uniref:uncharacterized protein LOC123524397 n=1 Tax=Mercenaria mercenaria TaxID=6596 RepID=UPI00234F1098|nr:uncharacterized protein LOC123524397 [Mercenaria mercenaria]XP_053394878.1 uncharacterized protein LOC123524397 [Mercenaria mercenaria]
MSQRKERYGRLTVLLSGCVTKWSRRLVLKCVKDSSPGDHEPHPWEVKHFLKHNRGKILRSDYGRKMDKMFNRSGNGDINIEDWDLPLCCFVLQEICQLPSNIAEDIKYVRKVRNQLCHAPSPELPDHRYEKYMGKLSQILQTGLAFINDIDLKEETMKEFDFCKTGLFSLDMDKCTDMNKQWRQQEAELGEIKKNLDQDDKEELIAVKRRHGVSNQTVPDAAVDLVLMGCTDDNRNSISELLVRLFDEKLSKNTDIFNELSQEHLKSIREAVSAAVTSLMSDGKEIISAKKKCVSLTIRCDSFVALASLLEECVTGEMTQKFDAVAVALRKAYGHCELCVVIFEHEFWKCIMETDTSFETDSDTSESRGICHGYEKHTEIKSSTTSEHEKGSWSPSVDESTAESQVGLNLVDTYVENKGSNEEIKNQVEQQEFEITEKCKLHTTKVVECFCSRHDVLCCTICVVSEHSKCGENVIYIPNEVRATDVADSPELKMVTNKLKALTERTTYSQSRVKLNREAIDAYQGDTKSYINQLQKEMNERFEQMKCEIDEKLNDFRREDTESMEALDSYCSSVLKILAGETNEIAEVEKSRNMCQLYITMKKQKMNAFKLEQQVKEIENRNEINRYNFQPDSKLVDLLQGKLEGIGRIIKQEAKTYKVRHVTNIDVTAQEDNDSSKCCVSGITVLSDEHLVASDSENKLMKLVCITENKVKASVLLMSSPADLTTINEKEIVVAIPDANTLQFVTLSDEIKLKADRRISVDQACHGVAYHDSKLIVSFIPKTYMRPSTVQILDMSGKRLKFIYQTWTGSPGYLTINSSTNTLYMSDWYNATVTSLSLDGTIKAVFSNKDMGKPNGIIHDSEGYVYVCGRKTNNIMQLSADCKHVQILDGLDANVLEPVSLAFSKAEQRMYVGMNSSKVIKAFYLI